jgi:hemolysin activation/secretion protein
LVRAVNASKNLDISEKMELGGAYAVRAYPEGESYGDEGYVATIEARLLLPEFGAGLPGRLQLIAFVDNGGVRYDRNRYFTGDRSRNLTGAGVGVNWFAGNSFLVKAAYAHRIGDARVTSEPDKSGRVWVQLSKFF